MSQESFTLYKLIVLYMLDHVAFPLTQAQISSFILDKGYTNYLTLQQAIGELCDIHMISTSEIKISVLIDESEADAAVQAVHNKFFR